jgi:cyclophilin family peptidyl-prolyl cis-trans isomerase
VFGEVADGMDVVDRIGGTQTDSRDRPVDAIGIDTLTVES